jgi:hypothetical protein
MPGEAHHVLRFPHLERARKEEDWTLLAVLVEMLRGMGRTLDRYGGLFPWLEEAVAERLDSAPRTRSRPPRGPDGLGRPFAQVSG